MTSDDLKSNSRREPTPEQKAALSLQNRSVAVRSGAGCGKTWVLTERFLDALEQKRELISLVAVTFTEKAAAELRGRIRAECRDRLIRVKGEESDAASRITLWRSILRAMEASRVSTFHTFCTSVLQRYPVESGVAPGFEVLDDDIAPTFRDDVLNTCVRDWLSQGHPDFEALAVVFGIDSLRRALRDVLQYRTTARLDNWAVATVDHVLEEWQEVWKLQYVPELMDRARRVGQHCLDALNQYETDGKKASENRKALLEDLPDFLQASEPDLELLDKIVQSANLKGSRASQWPTESAYREIQQHYGALRESLSTVKRALSWNEFETRQAIELGLGFARLADEAAHAFDRAKHLAEQLDFDDLLDRVRRFLTTQPEPSREELSREIALLLVDEFQDTDPVQAEILRAIVPDPPESGRLYLVGDSKQSIYRFRGAQPGIFDDFQGELGDDGTRVLRTNFRSLSEVLDFVNALFLGSDLDPDGQAALQAGVHVHAPKPNDYGPTPAHVEFLWAPDRDPEADEEAGSRKPGPSGRSDAQRQRREEAERIARLLRTRLDAGWPIWDVRRKAWRLAVPGDIAMLFRSTKDAGTYERALAEVGLDFHTVGGSAFFAQQEVLDLINLLVALEDPLDPLALAATLRSPLFCVSDEGLYWLATSSLEEQPADLACNLARGHEIANLAPCDRRRIAQAHAMLSQWRSRKDQMAIGDLIDLALEESGYEAALLAEPLGGRRRANVRKLVRLARRYDRAGYGLADFAVRLRTDLRRMTDEDQAATTTESEHAVQLLTIHKSKGLEFPIVILPNLGRRDPNPISHLTIHPQLGPLVNPDPLASDEDEENDEAPDTSGSLGRLLHRWIEKNASDEESLRLLYVATTRARNHLILSSGLSAEKLATSKEAEIQLLASRFDLETGRRFDPLPDGFQAPRVEVLNISHDENEASPLKATAGRQRSRGTLIARIRGVEHRSSGKTSRSRPILTIDLNELPNRSEMSRRIDRLVAAALPELMADETRALDSILERAARAQVPAASPRIRAAARSRLAATLEAMPHWRDRGVGPHQFGWSWRRAVVLPDGREIILRGTLDVVDNLGQSPSQALVIARHGLDEPGEWLRLVAGLAALEDSIKPCDQGLLIRLGTAPRTARPQDWTEEVIATRLVQLLNAMGADG